MRRSLGALAVSLLLSSAGAPALAQSAPSDLLGQWHGPSICVKADWNAACHDEEAYYDFVPGSASGRVLLHAYKIINGEKELMGDLEFSYDAASHAWTSDFQNTRVHVRWIFEPRGAAMTGRVVQLPSLRAARHVTVTRAKD